MVIVNDKTGVNEFMGKKGGTGLIIWSIRNC